jgi:hypothetical protein
MKGALLISLLIFSQHAIGFAASAPVMRRGEEIKAAYLTSACLSSAKKIDYLLKLINETELNAIVIDVKESAVYLNKQHLKTIKMFKDRGIYTIARIVVFQDSVLATKRPDLAIKRHNGTLWMSGRPVWKRYWTDPASNEVASYNIAIAKRAIDAGFDEVQFDYIRFPSDGPMNDIVYPFYDGQTPKHEVMEKFFARLRSELKAYNPSVILAIDMFGYVLQNGANWGIGQRLEGVAKYFDVLSPMAYPSHYRCKEFGIPDPNTAPFTVYDRTLAIGRGRLEKQGIPAPIIRPWIQDFSIRNIYGCGIPAVKYDADKIKAEFAACRKNGSTGFMLWNATSRFTREALLPKK